jgi:glycosyltransferase involved in cell wall biosynthesis
MKNIMKIYVNGKFHLVRMTGVQRVAVEIVSALEKIAAQNTEVKIEPVYPPAWIAKSHYRAMLALLWEQLILPWRCRDGLLLSLCNTGPIILKRQVLVLHDAAVFDMPGNYSWKYVLVQKLMMRLHALFKKTIYTVSSFSQQRLSSALGIPANEIGTLLLGCEHVHNARADFSILEKLKLRSGEYMLAVGSLQPGKNFDLLVKLAERQVFFPIVVVGGVDPSVFGGMDKKGQNALRYAGYVSDEELEALFTCARCYIQPSFYEGFGLPVLEAMARGIPVLCSNAASLPEVGGDAVLYFSPDNVDELDNLVSTVVDDAEAMKHLSELGKVRAQQFSWARSAETFIDQILSLKR